MIIKRRHISLLLILTMLATLFIGVGTASAYSSISAQKVKTISYNSTNVGVIKIADDAFDISPGDSITFTLPEYYVFADQMAQPSNTAPAFNTNGVHVPISYDGDTNLYLASDYSITGGGVNTNEFTLTLNNTASKQDNAHEVTILIYLNNIAISTRANDCIVSYEGTGGFPSNGNLLLARLVNNGKVTVSANGVQASSGLFNFTLQVRETFAGSLHNTNETLRLKLPRGFEWNSTGNFTPQLAEQIAAGDIEFSLGTNLEELKINYKAANKTTAASGFDVDLSFYVTNKLRTLPGPIIADSRGDSTISVDNITVGTYELDDISDYFTPTAEQTIIDAQSVAASISNLDLLLLLSDLLTEDVYAKIGGIQNAGPYLNLVRDAIQLDYFAPDAEDKVNQFIDTNEALFKTLLGPSITRVEIRAFLADFKTRALLDYGLYIDLDDLMTASNSELKSQLINSGFNFTNNILAKPEHNKIDTSLRGLGWNRAIITNTYNNLVDRIDPDYSAHKAVAHTTIKWLTVIAGKDGMQLDGNDLYTSVTGEALDIRLIFLGRELTALKTGSNQNVVSWETSDSNVVAVNNDGKLIAVGTGDATVSIKLNNPDKTTLFQFKIIVQ